MVLLTRIAWLNYDKALEIYWKDNQTTWLISDNWDQAYEKLLDDTLTKPKIDIAAVGECLVDFVSEQVAGALVLEGHPGGAPANVLAMASKLGCSTQMIAKVGSDAFGRFLINQLKLANVSTESMVRAEKQPTTLAIVSLDATGNRSFGFYRNHTADVTLDFSEIDKGHSAKLQDLSLRISLHDSRTREKRNASGGTGSKTCRCVDLLRPQLAHSALGRSLLWQKRSSCRA